MQNVLDVNDSSLYTQNITLDLIEFSSWKIGLHHKSCLSPSVADGRVLMAL